MLASLLKSLWHSPEVVDKISTSLNWSIAALGVLVLVFGGRSSYLQSKAANAQADRIAELEEKTKPIPLNVRIVTFLDSLDPRIVEGVKNGIYMSGGAVSPYQLTELQKLATEDKEQMYMILKTEPSIGFGEAGMSYNVELMLKPALIADAQPDG
jgi:hypothetical protein